MYSVYIILSLIINDKMYDRMQNNFLQYITSHTREVILTSAEQILTTFYFLSFWSVSYRLFHAWPFGQTIISGLHSYWSTHYLSIKERNWKETWVAWKGRVRTHIFLEFLKKYSLLHTLQVLFRMCRRQEDEVGFSSGLCWYLLGVE